MVLKYVFDGAKNVLIDSKNSDKIIHTKVVEDNQI
jgi:hypothetical protein